MKNQSHEAKAMHDTMFTDILKGMANQEQITQRLYSKAKTGVMYTWTPYIQRIRTQQADPGNEKC